MPRDRSLTKNAEKQMRRRAEAGICFSRQPDAIQTLCSISYQAFVPSEVADTRCTWCPTTGYWIRLVAFRALYLANWTST